MVEFDHLIFLNGLVAIPILVLVFLWMLRSRKKAIQSFGNPNLVSQLIADISSGRPVIKFILVAHCFNNVDICSC